MRCPKELAIRRRPPETVPTTNLPSRSANPGRLSRVFRMGRHQTPSQERPQPEKRTRRLGNGDVPPSCAERTPLHSSGAHHPGTPIETEPQCGPRVRRPSLRHRDAYKTTSSSESRRPMSPFSGAPLAARRLQQMVGATSTRPPCQGARSIYAAAAIVAGLARERASARRSEAPSPRQALPCMQARTCGCSRASRSRLAPVCGACA
jgi:hypothetical protein